MLIAEQIGQVSLRRRIIAPRTGRRLSARPGSLVNSVDCLEQLAEGPMA